MCFRNEQGAQCFVFQNQNGIICGDEEAIFECGMGSQRCFESCGSGLGTRSQFVQRESCCCVLVAVVASSANYEKCREWPIGPTS